MNIPQIMVSPHTSLRPTVDIRIVAFTFAHGVLYLHALPYREGLQLPSESPNPAIDLDDTARDVIRQSLGFSEQYMEQLYSLSRVDDDNWTIIISYLALICTDGEPSATTEGIWIPADTSSAFSDADQRVIDYALFRLRAKLGYTTIAFHLMPDQFTLSEVQSAFETILGRDLDKRNFRRRMATLGILAPTSDTRRDGSHRPARLYRFRPDRDPTDYLTPPWATTRPEE